MGSSKKDDRIVDISSRGFKVVRLPTLVRKQLFKTLEKVEIGKNRRERNLDPIGTLRRK